MVISSLSQLGAFGELEKTTRTPPYYVDEDYPEVHEINEPLPE